MTFFFAFILASFVPKIDAVVYKGIQIPDLGSGIIDRSYRFENFPALIKNEDNFKEWCNFMPHFFNDMSRADAEKWARNFCRDYGEQDACNTYFSDENNRIQLVNATIEYYEGNLGYTADQKKTMSELQEIRATKCLSIAEECYVSNGFKFTLTSAERDQMRLTTEDCWHRRPVQLNFAKKTCYEPLAALNPFQKLES
ncbi:unnamed protein product [Bursaphelenchus xylophilus]|uniref:(pine wood nematode) hypothetical protein n=1 Tax=Bursaphelenchus xylophilus TaxID=6326 RepID=A0A1I7S0U0_BURXY|nr:unnamed protein product [Bursaphelenchus xylophilus]CAG9088438.1 unnamed protein product [Bursaphelenchus xylophilus]